MENSSTTTCVSSGQHLIMAMGWCQGVPLVWAGLSISDLRKSRCPKYCMKKKARKSRRGKKKKREEPGNHSHWRRALRSPSPTRPTMPTDRGPSVPHLHSPGTPPGMVTPPWAAVPMHHHSWGEELFPNIRPDPPLVQPEAFPSLSSEFLRCTVFSGEG